MRMFKILWIMAAWAVLLSACASGSGPSLTLEEKLANRGYTLGEQVRSIRDWNLNGWSYIDDRHFVMHSGVKDYYLVTLRSRSFELDGAINIAFTTTVSSLTDKDKVLVRAPGGQAETLWIESLHVLNRGAAQNVSN